MAKFKVIVSDPSDKKSKAIELEGARAVPLIGKRIGETIDGSVVGISGVKLQITGGSDKDGFPMRADIHGGVRVSVVLSDSIGFHARREGERQRKTVRGNVITEDIVQINAKVSEKAKKAERRRREKKLKAEAVTEPQTAQPAATPSGGETSEETAQTAGG